MGVDVLYRRAIRTSGILPVKSFSQLRVLKTNLTSISLIDYCYILQGFQSGPVPGTFTRLRSCIVPAEITEPPKIRGGQNHKYDGR